MQIEIYNPTNGQPLPPIQWNYAELKAQLVEKLETYKGIVYAEDTLTVAKKDRANLNKLAAAIDGKRKEMKALYLHPYEEFEAQAKELTALVKDHSAAIDTQIKNFDEIRKEEKKSEIITLYESMIGSLQSLVPYEKLHNPKWLNVTTSISTISAELGGTIDRIISGLSSIDTLALDQDIANQVKGVFLQKFDLAAALSERERIEKQRTDLERIKAEKLAPDEDNLAQVNQRQASADIPSQGEITADSSGSIEDKLYTVDFRVHVTADKLKRLGNFMRENGIKPERI